MNTNATGSNDKGMQAGASQEPTAGRSIMPIMGSKLMSEIPWAMIAPHESQAQRNHGQTLERLAQRGGLAACEALDIIQGRKWASAKSCVENDHYLINLVRAWRASGGTAP